MLCCETRSCHARRHNDLERHSNFSSTIYLFFFYSVLGTLLLWRSTVAFTYLKVESAKCLCLLPRGLGIGVKNLVLFTSLISRSSQDMSDNLMCSGCCWLYSIMLRQLLFPTKGTLGPYCLFFFCATDAQSDNYACTASQESVACLIFYNLNKPEPIIVFFGVQYHDNPIF